MGHSKPKAKRLLPKVVFTRAVKPGLVGMGNWFKSLCGRRDGNLGPLAHSYNNLRAFIPPPSIVFTPKFSSPPIIPTRVTEYKRSNVVSVRENATCKRLPARPSEIRTASAAQPARPRPRPHPEPAPSRGAAPPRAAPSTTTRRAQLLVSSYPGEHRSWEK